MVEITSKEQNKVKGMIRTEHSLRDFWDNIKCTNIQIIGVPEEEEKKKLYEKMFGRWQRNRTGRTLSPPQIHQKSI